MRVKFMNNIERRVFSNSPWEKSISYCRAIQKGPLVAISGTTSMQDGKVYAPESAELQTRKCLEIIEVALSELGFGRKNIFRTRMFVTDISKWQEFGKVHGEFFESSPPATSMYEVSGLILPELLIEIEAEAYFF
jgi:enamine deaminase RidA (YjgF/YER057c/UK114 family)